MSGPHYRVTDAQTGDYAGISEEAGIVCGALEAWADELETSAEEVLEAIETTGVTPLVDTAEDVGRGSSERPTCPTLRHLAFRRRDVALILDAVTPEVEPYAVAA
ncbi:hypothetical protein CRI94_17355 [Longibacter salinarum]|uniref:Uncharacterized protein n=1 Tax=Longibacter salinarum TaxID=1850348 RepID=A0A2A8CTA5_9BACT|nr:hypothetical protein [Longibacter salinarum]PEN10384.1 hypothetical protein CRI94_17355 [Longibacter salinarum]